MKITKLIKFHKSHTEHEHEIDIEKIRDIVLKYGQNPSSYLALEDDKKYFLGNSVEGVVAYTIVSNIMVCCGDIICKKEDVYTFLDELHHFCKKRFLQIILLNTTEYFMDAYKAHGFGAIKYGEDACFKLSEYNLKGGRVAKVRAAINRANKDGITVHEYKFNEQKDEHIEEQMKQISNEWLEGKALSEMSFMLGGLGLDNPMDKRYFYALDANNQMVGVVCFIPYLQKKAYLADVTRYKKDASPGVLEKIIYDAFMVMRDEGIEWGSMGLAPLYNVCEKDKKIVTEKLFEFVYEHLNSGYGFKSLHFAKEKYAPTDWQSRYLFVKPKIFTPQHAYAIVKAQNPKGVTKMVLDELKAMHIPHLKEDDK